MECALAEMHIQENLDVMKSGRTRNNLVISVLLSYQVIWRLVEATRNVKLVHYIGNFVIPEFVISTFVLI